MNREQELKAALRKANLPPGPHKVYYHFAYNRADWKTGRIPDERQPRSLCALAAACGVSTGSLRRYVKFLDDLGWLVRTGGQGRGVFTRYQLAIGVPVPRTSAMTDAERARRYRERKKSAQIPVTDSQEKCSEQRDENTSDLRDASHGLRDDFAGQGLVLLKGINEGEVVKDGWLCQHAGDDGHCDCWHNFALSMLDAER